MQPTERLCLFASPRADDFRGETARLLREGGLTLWVWPPIEPLPLPAEFDALVVQGGDEWPGTSVPALVALLRQAWHHGTTIGLFGGAAELLTAADIAPGGAPIEAPGLFIDAELPVAGTVQEMVDAIAAGPHLDR